MIAVVGIGALLAATPAAAEQIGVDQAAMGPVLPGPQQAVHVLAAPGEQNDITVRATNPTGTDSADPLGFGWPLTVTVTDQNATFDPAPPSGDLPCQVLDAHTARCTASPGSFFMQAVVQMGDGNNRLQFTADTVPLREQFTAGAGNDVVSTGPFAGDASYRWASDVGGGNDTVRIGPLAREGIDSGPYFGLPPSGLAVYLGAGNDTAYAVNGAADEVDCGDGNDVLSADPFDSEQIFGGSTGVCETRTV